MRYDYQKINRILARKIQEELHFTYDLRDDSNLVAYKRKVEGAFAEYIGKKFCYAVDSGTSATQLALVLLGVGEGDEVLIPALSYPSLIHSVLYTGATPVFVDSTEHYTLDTEALRQKITPATKAIIPVHMFGLSCDMESINRVAREQGIVVIEDACQAHGSTFKGKKLGSLSDIGVFSFTYHKTLAAYGGGALVFDDFALYEKLDLLLKVEKDNALALDAARAPSRMSVADLAHVHVKLKVAHKLEENKKQLLSLYHSLLKGCAGVRIIPDQAHESSVRQMFVAAFDKREALQDYLLSKGIQSKLPYKPFFALSSLSHLSSETFARTKEYYDCCLFLPMHLYMKEEEVKAICTYILEFYQSP